MRIVLILAALLCFGCGHTRCRPDPSDSARVRKRVGESVTSVDGARGVRGPGAGSVARVEPSAASGRQPFRCPDGPPVPKPYPIETSGVNSFARPPEKPEECGLPEYCLIELRRRQVLKRLTVPRSEDRIIHISTRLVGTESATIDFVKALAARHGARYVGYQSALDTHVEHVEGAKRSIGYLRNNPMHLEAATFTEQMRIYELDLRYWQSVVDAMRAGRCYAGTAFLELVVPDKARCLRAVEAIEREPSVISANCGYEGLTLRLEGNGK